MYAMQVAFSLSMWTFRVTINCWIETPGVAGTEGRCEEGEGEDEEGSKGQEGIATDCSYSQCECVHVHHIFKLSSSVLFLVFHHHSCLWHTQSV